MKETKRTMVFDNEAVNEVARAIGEKMRAARGRAATLARSTFAVNVLAMTDGRTTTKDGTEYVTANLNVCEFHTSQCPAKKDPPGECTCIPFLVGINDRGDAWVIDMAGFPLAMAQIVAHTIQAVEEWKGKHKQGGEDDDDGFPQGA